MVKFKGIEMTVQVDGRNLQEYNDDDEVPQENVVSRYVQAISEAEFAINIKVPSDYRFTSTSLNFRAYAEGKFIRARTCKRNETAFKSSITGRLYQGEAGWKAQPLVFAEITPGRS